MNFATIKKYDVANGPGVRVSLFVSGCEHRCKGCFNAEAWDFAYGEPFTAQTAEEICSALERSYIAGLSLLGGEPFDPRNQESVCGYDGEIIINDDNEWECPNCHNKDHRKMNVTRRTCGYLGENFWNLGKTKEIKARVLHL